MDEHDKRADEWVSELWRTRGFDVAGDAVIPIPGPGDEPSLDVLVAAELRRASAEGEARGYDRAAVECKRRAVKAEEEGRIPDAAALSGAAAAIRALKAVPRG